MERLTEFHGGIWGLSSKAVESGYDRYSVYSRLAAYENTGLTPEEIMDGKMLTGWIPVSERLPNCIGETILLTVDINKGISHGKGSIDIAYLRNDEEKFFYGSTENYLFDNVLAWMPLPEPYKAE